jgi:hypothetical protein
MFFYLYAQVVRDGFDGQIAEPVRIVRSVLVQNPPFRRVVKHIALEIFPEAFVNGERRQVRPVVRQIVVDVALKAFAVSRQVVLAVHVFYRNVIPSARFHYEHILQSSSSQPLKLGERSQYSLIFSAILAEIASKWL